MYIKLLYIKLDVQKSNSSKEYIHCYRIPTRTEKIAEDSEMADFTSFVVSVVSMRYDPPHYTFTCAGFIISQRHVITSRECLKGYLFVLFVRIVLYIDMRRLLWYHLPSSGPFLHLSRIRLKSYLMIYLVAATVLWLTTRMCCRDVERVGYIQ